ncbi:MAG: hypothetical protein CVU38_10815 [Chloroflexi bacterium HGW-Chloroflexi-1]|nr:MAG: hypothetical protein CVU38_10815 [Chloroflexi bacterium HGW-Chloroflexi-1]
MDKYEFSEPRVVLTNTAGIDIAGWLPDGNRLLITRSYPKSYRERIETLDIRSGEVQVYAERDHHNGKPVWLSAIQGVAYSTIPGQQVELRINRLHPSETEIIVISEGNNIALGFSLAVEPGGRHLMYLVDRSGGRPQIWDSVGRATQAAFFDVTEWREFPYPDSAKNALPRWSPNGAQLAVFAYPTLFLVEPGPNRVCEVNLGSKSGVPRFALDSHWSPNARYLAMIATARLPGELVRFTDLVVMDIHTGASRQIQLAAKQVYITDLSWDSSSRYLIALAQVEVIQERPVERLFLVDTVIGNVRPMLPERAFGGGSIEGEQMAWSPNGQIIALKCPVWLETEPTITEDRVCLISAKVRP